MQKKKFQVCVFSKLLLKKKNNNQLMDTENWNSFQFKWGKPTVFIFTHIYFYMAFVC